MASKPPRRPCLAWPILLIGLGIVLLLNNLGLFPWSIWDLLARFWPVMLILIGVELLLSRANPWLAAAVAVVVVLLVVAGGVATAAFGLGGGGFGGLSRPGSASPAERAVQELGQAERATVDIRFGAGELIIGNLPGDSANLMEGDFAHDGGSRAVSRAFDCRGGDCTLSLASRGERSWPFGKGGAETWQVKLSPRVPLELEIKSGASRLDLDLSALQLSALRVDVGASSGTLKLPQTVAKTVVIKAGAADLDVEVPQETAARIQARGGLSTFQIDEQRFPRDGSYYASPDFATATSRVDLAIDAGVATVRVR